MMPNPEMGGMMGGGAPVPVGPGPESAMDAGEQPNPDAIRQQLKMLLTQAKKIADQNGVDFADVVSEVEGNKTRSDVPLPRPPKPAY